MNAALYDLPRPSAEAGAVAGVCAEHRDRPPHESVLARPPRIRNARIAGGPVLHVEPASRQDDEAASNFLPPSVTGASVRATVPASHELA